MGQCCLTFTKSQPPEETKHTELLTKSQLSVQYHTRNDKEFTYFLGVYNLLTLGQRLESPPYLDELHPDFSYQKFTDCYSQYQKQIQKLGKYIENCNNKDSNICRRVAVDRLNIDTFKKNNKVPPGKPGCLIKMQLQEVRWTGAKQLSLKLLHPAPWTFKFEKEYKVDLIQLGPVYVQFCIPQYKEAIIQITAKEARGQIRINIEQCINNDEAVLCKVMKWKGASSIQGVALRMQIVNQQSQGQKLKISEMKQLFNRLNQDYRADEIEPSMSEKDIAQKIQRHRNSVNQKYRMTGSRKE